MVTQIWVTVLPHVPATTENHRPRHAQEDSHYRDDDVLVGCVKTRRSTSEAAALLEEVSNYMIWRATGKSNAPVRCVS